jgi:hypothetical protein
MRTFFKIALLMVVAILAQPTKITAQNNIIKGTGVIYTDGVPTVTINPDKDAEIAIDTATGLWYEFQRDSNVWVKAGFRIYQTGVSGVPSYTPTDKQSHIVINNGDSLFHYRSGTWNLVSGGGTDAQQLTRTNGRLFLTNSTNVVLPDSSSTNEGQLTLSRSADSTVYSIISNTFGSNTIWLKSGTNMTFSGTSSGNTDTLVINSSGGSGITELTGDVTAGPGSGSQVATIANDAVTSAKILNGTIATADLADSLITEVKLLSNSVGTTALKSGSVTNLKLADGSVSGTKIAMGSDAQGDILYYNGSNYTRLAAGTNGQFLKTQGAGANPLWATASGTGDIVNGGNTTGATVVIGTNDANALEFETNNVTRSSVTGGASTGGAWTFTDVTSKTNTVEDIFTLRSNSTGTAAASFGTGILLKGESSTTDNQDMARISSYWTTATHASREAALSFQLGDNGGSIAEVMKLDRVNSSTGVLSIGSSSPVTISNSGMTAAATFTITGHSSGQLYLTSARTGTAGIRIATTGTGSNENVQLGGEATYTHTSGGKYDIFNFGHFAPTSGTGTYYVANYAALINQTGGASGATGMIYIGGPNLTVTNAADFRAIHLDFDKSGAHAIYQSGANTKNYYAGPSIYNNYIEVLQMSAPSTPANGYGRIYKKTDDKLYFKNEAGTEYDLTAGGGSVSDRDYTDIDVTSSGTVWTVDTNAITTIKISDNNVTDAKIRQSAGLSVIGRSANSTGNVADITASSDNQVLRRSGTSIGFGTVATGGLADSLITEVKLVSNSVGTTALKSGAVTTLKVNDNAITYAKLQDVTATNRFLGRITSGSGDPEELTGTQATTLLDNFTSSLKGLAPASGGGTTNFLRADGTWAAPSGAADGNGIYSGSGTIPTSTIASTAYQATTDNFIIGRNLGTVDYDGREYGILWESGSGLGGVYIFGGDSATQKYTLGKFTNSVNISSSTQGSPNENRGTLSIFADDYIEIEHTINGTASTVRVVADSIRSVSEKFRVNADSVHFKINGSHGTNGQVLKSDGYAVYWGTDETGGGGYTDEQAQDAVGAMLNSSLTYVDGTPLLHIADRDFGDWTTSSNGTVATIDNGVISTAKLADSSVTEVKLISNSVGTTALKSGAVTTLKVADNNITLAKLQEFTAHSIIGNATNISSATPTEITASADHSVLRRNGTSLGFGTVNTGGITDAAITYAKIQNVAANSVLANNTGSSATVTAVALGASELLGRGSSGNIAAITVGSGLSMSGTTLSATGGGSNIYNSNGEVTNRRYVYSHPDSTLVFGYVQDFPDLGTNQDKAFFKNNDWVAMINDDSLTNTAQYIGIYDDAAGIGLNSYAVNNGTNLTIDTLGFTFTSDHGNDQKLIKVRGDSIYIESDNKLRIKVDSLFLSIGSLPSSGQVLTANSNGSASWATPSSGGITQLTGDVTAGPGSGSQAATIAANAVTDSKLRQSAGLSVIGRSANSTGNVADITSNSEDQVLRRSGTSIGFGQVATGGLTDSLITSAKILSNAVGTTALASGSVTSLKILDGTIVAADIANNTITSSQVNSSIIVDGGNSTGGTLTIGNSSNRGLGISTNAVNRIYIDSVGLVGVGTSTPSLGNIHIVSETDPAGIGIDAYGSITPTIVSRRARGTLASPTASQTDDIIYAILARGYGSTGFSSGSRGAIMIKTAQTWTDANNGTHITFETTANNTTTRTERVRFANDGNVGIGLTSPTAVLHLKAGTATANTSPLKFNSGTNLTTAESGAVEYDGTNFFMTNSTPTRCTVMKSLSASATLNFGSTAAQNSADLTITVTGAAEGEEVILGVPNAAVNANSSYTAWVSATNTVTVRFNNYSSGSIDPASATFKVSVIKR